MTFRDYVLVQLLDDRAVASVQHALKPSGEDGYEASISIKHVSGLSCCKIVAWGFDYCRSPRHNIEMFTQVYQKNKTRDNENYEIFCTL